MTQLSKGLTIFVLSPLRCYLLIFKLPIFVWRASQWLLAISVKYIQIDIRLTNDFAIDFD